MSVEPIIELRTGTVVGHEAVAAFVETDEPLHEVYRRAHAIGIGDLLEAAVVRAAVTTAEPPSEHDVYVSVSVSALASDRFWAAVPSRLDGVVVELREGYDPVDVGTFAAVVQKLRSLGPASPWTTWDPTLGSCNGSPPCGPT